MATLDEEPGIAQRVGQLRFDTQRFSACNALQMQRRPGQHLDPAAKHAAGGADAGLVLIEALPGSVVSHADVHAVGAAVAIGEIEQHQVEVVAPTARGTESECHLIQCRQPLDVAHRQPLGNPGGGTGVSPMAGPGGIGGAALRHKPASAASMLAANSPRIHSWWMQCAPDAPSPAASAACRHASSWSLGSTASGRAVGASDASNGRVAVVTPVPAALPA